MDPPNVKLDVEAMSRVATVIFSPLRLFSTMRDVSCTSSVFTTVSAVGDVAVSKLFDRSVKLDSENTLLGNPVVRPVAVSVNALAPSIVSDVTPDSVPATTTSMPLIVYVDGNTRIVKSLTVSRPDDVASPTKLLTTRDDGCDNVVDAGLHASRPLFDSVTLSNAYVSRPASISIALPPALLLLSMIKRRVRVARFGPTLQNTVPGAPGRKDPTNGPPQAVTVPTNTLLMAFKDTRPPDPLPASYE
jgi:hypothetical protein